MLIFVYGTLKRGGKLHGWMRDIEFISEGFASEVDLYLPNKKFMYPFCVKEEDASGVYGEVYKIDNTELKMLDMVEGYPDLYKREEVTVTLTGGNKENCIIYLLRFDIDLNDFRTALKF